MRVPLNTGIPANIDERLSTLGALLEARCPAIEFAYVFGSRAMGEQTERSDIDVAIFVSPEMDLEFNRLETARVAAHHLGTDAIDIVLLNVAPIAVAGRVLISRRVIIDRRPFRRHEFESRTLRLFHDFRVREHRILSERYAHG